MISTATIVYSLLALIGGALGSYLSKARLGAGVYAAAAGFLASVAVQLAGGSEAIAFGAFLVTTVIVTLLFKLRPLQIVAIVLAIVVVSVAGQFLMSFFEGFSSGFAEGFSNALNHSRRR